MRESRFGRPGPSSVRSASFEVAGQRNCRTGGIFESIQSRLTTARVDIHDTDMTSVLSFEVSGVKGGAIITPRIDGVLLTTMAEQFEVSHGMTDPAGGYGGLLYAGGSLERYFPANTAERIYVLACDCGELGCWPLICFIDAANSRIRLAQLCSASPAEARLFFVRSVRVRLEAIRRKPCAA